MKHCHVIACPFCGSEDLVKHGHNSSGVQRCQVYWQEFKNQ